MQNNLKTLTEQNPVIKGLVQFVAHVHNERYEKTLQFIEQFLQNRKLEATVNDFIFGYFNLFLDDQAGACCRLLQQEDLQLYLFIRGLHRLDGKGEQVFSTDGIHSLKFPLNEDNVTEVVGIIEDVFNFYNTADEAYHFCHAY